MDILSPDTLDQYIGQPVIVKRIKQLVAESTATCEKMPHLLLMSEPGMGKTTLARLIAKECGDQLEDIDLSQVTAKRFPNILIECDCSLVFLDEIHRAKQAQQEMLLQWLAEGIIVVPNGGTEVIDYLSAIAATTRIDKLDAAFLDRFIKFELQPYEDETMQVMVAAMATKVGLELPTEHANRLAVAALGVPRAAGRLVKAYKTLTYSGKPSVEETLKFLDCEPDGLTADHMKYLRMLYKFGGVNALGERPLATVTGMHRGVMFQVERDLMIRGYLDLTPEGRMLTKNGRARVSGERVRPGRNAA